MLATHPSRGGQGGPLSKIIFPQITNTAAMKSTTWFMCGILIVFGVCASVYALVGFDLLGFLCFGNLFIYRAVLSLTGVAALWLLFWLVAFRPTKFLS